MENLFVDDEQPERNTKVNRQFQLSEAMLS